MRVLQLIDSLRPGGAEKMSVTYANALVGKVEASFLCATRLEGKLRQELSAEVGYLFLKKKNSIDPLAFQRLRKFVQRKKIDVVQAHSSSIFLAVILKRSLPKIKLIWHDHYGGELESRKFGLLRPSSRSFDGIIAVNQGLKEWSEKYLHPTNLRYLRNFLPLADVGAPSSKELKGTQRLNIVCLANLRPQKDHLNLLRAFQLLSKEQEVKLHLVGKDDNDSYSAEIKSFVHKNQLQDSIFLYGEQEEVWRFLNQADLGVLSSSSEGLPLALLEYGRAGLPVVCTRVGECPEVLESWGILVPPKDPKALALGITSYLEDENRRKMDAKGFQNKISREFSEEAVITEVLEFYKEVTSIS